MTLTLSKILHGDCLELMKDIPDNSIDMVLSDLPYGTTKNQWDIIIPFEDLWKQYNRIIKDTGIIALTASNPFDKILASSNIDMFKYEWIWEKSRPTGHMNSKIMPLKNHESVLIFSKGKKGTYNPIMSIGNKNHSKPNKQIKSHSTNYGKQYEVVENITTEKFPKTIIKDIKSVAPHQFLHPTQKPVALFEYLIKTYTNEGDLVLDNCAGSGTTAIAAINTNRNYICIEKDEKYFNIMENRIEKHIK